LVHIFGFKRGRTNDLIDLESHMVNKSHATEKPQHKCSIQCNYKAVRVYSIEFNKKFEKKFLYDISPFNHGSGELRDSLKLFADSFRGQFGLKFDGGGVGLRQTNIPSQRYHINVFMLGYRDGGKKMRRYYILVESQRKYTDQFIDWLEHRVYQTQLPNNPSFVGNPVVRELRLFDITTFETCARKMFEDLKPFYSVTDFMNGWVKGIYLLGLRVFGLNKPPVSNIKSVAGLPFNRDNIGVVILAEKDDVKLQDPDNPNVIAEMV